MAKAPFQSKLINLKELAALTGVPYATLYNYKSGRSGVKGMNPTIRAQIVNAMTKELRKVFDDFDCSIDVNRKD